MEVGKASGSVFNTDTEIAEKRRDVEKLRAIYEGLSEKGKIMMLTYSTAISDKELADEVCS